MKQTLSLRTGLALTMTPALQQAIRLLQLSSLDLQLEIRQALESNVMLELTDDEAGEETDDLDEALAAATEAETSALETVGERALEISENGVIPEEMPVDADWSDIYDGVPGALARDGDDGTTDFLQQRLHTTEGLREHLVWQASIAPFDETDAEIAVYLIDAVNDEGYLEDWEGLVARIRERFAVDQTRIERVLDAVQDFDPPGVAARDLSECLRLQLTQFRQDTPLRAEALRLLEAPMALIARRDPDVLAKVTGLPAEVVPGALALIARLQPHPGRPFQSHENDYVAPDVHVAKREGRWRVSLNPEHTPKLRVNRYYQSLIRRADTSRDQLTLKQHLAEARYFISSLEARNQTLLRVAQCIVEEQRAFLEYGPEAMRPLVLRDIADRLGVHESTVSRATANKYMLTPRGLYELKHFFSSHVHTTQGGTCSATAIQAMIKRLITQEDTAQPLSDAALTDLLQREGIQVARRTVAKYREALRIPPSHERKPPA
ncbi:MAG: RNA polymerase factor sigma-54 [Gammaproteobacteria bacterium]|nr:RNA polymerase factor sigma-54 [Gammaproteobacteria bacterium]